MMSPAPGFYLMHRGWMENPIFRNEPYTEAQAWCWLIENAAFADHQQRFGSIIVDLHRGQVAASIRFLAKAWGWEQTKIQRFLTRLKTATMIATEIATGVTVITVCNYTFYQGDCANIATPNATPNTTAPPQHRHKEEQGNKKENISRSSAGLFDLDSGKSSEPDQFEIWWAYAPRKVAKGQAKAAFKAALKKAGSIDILVDGIQRYAAAVVGKDERYIAHPATWLNGERWLDDAGHEIGATDDTSGEFKAELEAARAKGVDSPEFVAFIERHRGRTGSQEHLDGVA